MKYVEVLFFWCLVNLLITYIGWEIQANLFALSIYFLTGVFVILLFELGDLVSDVRETFEELEH